MSVVRTAERADPTSWCERSIAAAICRQTLRRKCVVLIPNCKWTGHECDVLAVTTDLRVIDIEIKISVADFRADAKKEKWWHSRYTPWQHGKSQERARTHRDHPPKVWKHYYAIPREIWRDDLAAAAGSPASGILLLEYNRRGKLIVTCARRSKPARDAYRLSAEQAVDVARLANLRMWDALQQVARR